MCLLYLRIFILLWMDVILCLQKNQLDLFKCRRRKIFEILLCNQLSLCLFHMIRGKTDLFTQLWTKRIRVKFSFCKFILLILLKIYLQCAWVWYLYVYNIVIVDILRVCKIDICNTFMVKIAWLNIFLFSIQDRYCGVVSCANPCWCYS